MSEDIIRADALPGEVIREDVRLEQETEEATVALAKHRWEHTKNPNNPDAVSFRAYGRAVGRHATTISRFVEAYVLYTSSDGQPRSFADCYARALRTTDARVAIKATADALNISMASAKAEHYDIVKQVAAAMTEEADRRERDGKPFDEDDREMYAERLARRIVATRERNRLRREEEKRGRSRMFLAVGARLETAKQNLKRAFDEQDGVEFDEEEVALLDKDCRVIEEMARITRAAITGDPAVDVTGELLRLEEFRQDG